MDKGEIAKMNVKEMSFLLLRLQRRDALATQTRSNARETH